MSDIGYAVFGTPKGIAVQSNGLFTEYNLDNTLYLDNSHIILNKGESLLLIRRISLPNTNSKNAVLVSLYHHALQHGENRPGSFVGSAICLKGKMPNAEMVINGLTHLFKEIKKISLDENNRFKSNNGDSWKIKLPDPNKDYGMFDEGSSLSIKNSPKKISVVKVLNFVNDIKYVLQHFCLNQSISTEYLYVTDNQNIIKRLNEKGVNNIKFSSLFDYKEHFKKLNAETENLVQKKSKLNSDINQLDNNKKNLEDKNKTLEETKTQLNDTIEKTKAQLNNYEARKKEQEAQLKKELSNLFDRKFQLESQIQKNTHSQPKNPDEFFKESAKILRKHKKEYVNKHPFSGDQDLVEQYLSDMPNRMKEQNKFNIIIISVLISLFVSLIAIIVYLKMDNPVKENVSEVKNKALIEKKDSPLSEVKKYQDKKKENIESFYTPANQLLNNYLANKTNSEETEFIKEYDWEFWQFDFENEDLIKKLNLNDKYHNEYLVNLKAKEIKPLEERKITTLENYLKEDNDIYQEIDSSILEHLKNKRTLVRHFEWLVKKCNDDKSIEDLKKENKKMKLPYFKK